ncbi:nuclear transport factor 2 family protein [uncultured Roseobacter sp.]|uniref:YybH family protein n=1 Tax=uncultured Roseobacter sp. TaxID=114847 RepID=UPI0026307FE0|nr:nuclear transport factor 2 family protein [uncultured Roseobacter sp.]
MINWRMPRGNPSNLKRKKAAIESDLEKLALEATVSAKSFVKEYEHALGTQDWSSVAPLISDDAIVIFSNGSLHAGKEAIRAAYQHNFNTIKSEKYRIENVHWLAETADAAAYSFEFHWIGEIEGREASGSGRGTAVLVRIDDCWLLAGEQLGPKS